MGSYVVALQICLVTIDICSLFNTLYCQLNVMKYKWFKHNYIKTLAGLPKYIFPSFAERERTDPGERTTSLPTFLY